MSLPYFNYYPKDMGYKTMHLTLAEFGAYNRLLSLCWTTPGCTIPKDIEWIARKMLIRSEQDKAVLLAILDEFFIVIKGQYANKRLLEEYKKSDSKYKIKVKAAKKGGAATALKYKEKDSANRLADDKAIRRANQNQNLEPEPEPIINNILYREWRPKTLNATTKTAQMVRDHMSKDIYELELEKFVEFHIDNKTESTDFNRQWRTWLKNHFTYNDNNKKGKQNVRNNKTNKYAQIGEQRRANRGNLLKEYQS